MFRPPWPWPIRRFGEAPEDWQGEGYSQYFGLEFPTEIEIPCDDVCNFLVGSTWTLEGSFEGEVETNATYGPIALPSPFEVKSTVSEAEAPLGQSVTSFFDENGTMSGDPVRVGTAWHELDSVYELTPPPIIFPVDAMVSVRATHQVIGTSSNESPDEERVFFVEYEATAHLPELCKNEDGETVWRIKMTGYINIVDPLYPLMQVGPSSKGLEFVDSDHPQNSKILESSASGFSLKLTVERPKP